MTGAQTWDWHTDMADNWLGWTVPFVDGRSLATLTEFGILGKIGVNDAGLGLLFSILYHAFDGRGVGVPVHVLARAVLDRARTVEEALAVVADAELSASSTFSLLDASGTTAVELFPEGRGIVLSGAGWLARTHHFLSTEGAPGDRSHVTSSNSPIRLAALTDYLRSVADRTAAGLVSALCGHDPDGPLCVHTSAEEPGFSTLATVVIDTSMAQLSVWRGWPCATPLARL